MKHILLIATLALAACSSGDPYEDARISASLAALGGGLNSYGASMTAASYQPPRAVLCQPVGHTVMCY